MADSNPKSRANVKKNGAIKPKTSDLCGYKIASTSPTQKGAFMGNQILGFRPEI